MDPLSALRDYTIRGDLDKIHKVGNEFHFSTHYSFPCNIETAYRSKQGNLYTLETLLFFVKNRHIKQPEYIKLATNQSIPTVTFVDRKPLLDYLEGRSSSSLSIQFVEQYRPDLPLFAPTDVDPDLKFPADVDLKSPADVDPEGTDHPDLMRLIKEIEFPLRDRNAVLTCRNRDFYNIYLGAVKREQEKDKPLPHQPQQTTAGKSKMNKDDGVGGPVQKKVKVGSKTGGEGVPIILVPSAASTLITMYNVKEFLEDGVFVPTEVKMKQMKGMKPECVTVQKKFSRDKDKVMTAYEVRDKPSSLKADDWDRVVAVFVLGKEWQFKDWPFKDHVDIFNKIIGFYMRFEDDSIESAKIVKQWNVKIISISKNKRHQDRAAALEVWGKLEEFVSRSRS